MVTNISESSEGGFQPWILYTIIGLAVFVGGYLVYANLTEGTKPLSSPWICMAEECGNVKNIAPKLGDPAPPLVCSKCGNKTLVPAFVCPKCNTYVVMNYWRHKSGMTRCPKCGIEIEYDD